MSSHPAFQEVIWRKYFGKRATIYLVSWTKYTCGLKNNYFPFLCIGLLLLCFETENLKILSLKIGFRSNCSGCNYGFHQSIFHRKGAINAFNVWKIHIGMSSSHWQTKHLFLVLFPFRFLFYFVYLLLSFIFFFIKAAGCLLPMAWSGYL